MNNFRITTTPVLKALFSNIPLESGLSDDEIVSTVTPHIPHKTFSRLRIELPNSISSDQLIMMARFAQTQSVADSADIIALARDPNRLKNQPQLSVLSSRSCSRSVKSQFRLNTHADGLRATAGKICIFDRADSFAYLRPHPESEDESNAISESIDCSQSLWLPPPSSLRYERKPRVFAIVTPDSLAARVQEHGDSGMEELIGNVDSGEHSLTVVDDSPRTAHKVFRGVFADARAVAIFGRHSMLVLPEHQRSVRVFDAAAGPIQQQLIADSLRSFHRMRRFRVHAPAASRVKHLLQHRLSYRAKLPGHK